MPLAHSSLALVCRKEGIALGLPEDLRLKRASMPETIQLYDLRHTCATLLLATNVHPKYVQELLGHASITLTLDTYSHVLPGMDVGAASAMDEALG